MSKEAGDALVNLDVFDMSIDTDEVIIPGETPAGKSEEELAAEAEAAAEVAAEETETDEEREAREQAETEESETAEENETEEEKEARLAAEAEAAAEPGDDAPSFKPLAKSWFEENNWDWDDSLLENDSLAGFNDLVKAIVDNSSQPKYANEDSRRFDEYLKNGGNPKEFFEAVYSAPDYDSINMENEGEQKMLVRQMLRETTQFSDKKIEKEIERLGHLEELKVEAEEALEFLKEKTAKADAELEAEQAKRQEAEQARLARYQEEETRDIMSTEDFRGIKATRADKEGFVKYLFDKDRKTGLTPYQAFLKENPNYNKEAAFMAFKNITAKNFDTKLKTKATNEIFDNINKFSKSKGITGTNRAAEPKKKGGKRETNLDNFIL